MLKVSNLSEAQQRYLKDFKQSLAANKYEDGFSTESQLKAGNKNLGRFRKTKNKLESKFDQGKDQTRQVLTSKYLSRLEQIDE